MSRKKKKSGVKRKNSKLLSLYRSVVVILIIGGVATTYVTLVSPLISDSRQVLGEDTYQGPGKGSVMRGKTQNVKPDMPQMGESMIDGEYNAAKVEKLRNLPPIEAESKNTGESIEITQGGVITDLENKSSGRGVTVKADRGNGNKEELSGETFDDIKRRLNATDMQIATNGGGFVVGGNHIGARTHFPLSIDLSTNTLMVTTPNGQKAVTVLPDKAVQNILSRGVLSKIGGGIATGSADLSGGDATTSGDITFGGASLEEGEETEIKGDENIALELENGELVYKVEGESTQKLFGFVPVGIKKTVVVSAESGEIKSTSSPIFHKVLDLMSF